MNARFPNPLILIGWFYAGFAVMIPAAKHMKGDPWYQVEMTATMGITGAIIFFGLSLVAKHLLRRYGDV
jgi:hypothetical protein